MKTLLLPITLLFIAISSICCEKDSGPTNPGIVPNTPTLSSPVNGERDVSVPSTLVWNASNEATSYTLQVSTESLFSHIVYDTSGLTTTSHQISELHYLTKYYWHVNATNKSGTSGWSTPIWSFTTRAALPCPGIPTVEYVGKTYNTVQIGSQCWFKENLDVGTMIQGSESAKDNDIIEKYCYNDDTVNCKIYGGLYQWWEAMQYVTTSGATGICPPGWHIPTLEEFKECSTTVGGDGNAMKALGQGTDYGVGTDTSGFSALLSGTLARWGSFYGLGLFTYFWSSNENINEAIYLGLNRNDNDVDLVYCDKIFGFSIRCLKN